MLFGVCHNTCFRWTRRVINSLKSATSNTTTSNNDYYYHNSNKIIIMRCSIEALIGGFRQFSAYFGHPVYFGLSSNGKIARHPSFNY